MSVETLGVPRCKSTSKLNTSRSTSNYKLNAATILHENEHEHEGDSLSSASAKQLDNVERQSQQSELLDPPSPKSEAAHTHSAKKKSQRKQSAGPPRFLLFLALLLLVFLASSVRSLFLRSSRALSRHFDDASHKATGLIERQSFKSFQMMSFESLTTSPHDVDLGWLTEYLDRQTAYHTELYISGKLPKPREVVEASQRRARGIPKHIHPETLMKMQQIEQSKAAPSPSAKLSRGTPLPNGSTRRSTAPPVASSASLTSYALTSLPNENRYVMPATPTTLSPNTMNMSQFIYDAGSCAPGRASPSADYWGDQLVILGGTGDFQDLNIWTFDPSQAPNQTAWQDWPLLKGVPLICCGGQVSAVQVNPENSATNYAFWFGGAGLDSSYPNSMFAYDFTAYAWTTYSPAVAPSGRSFFCMASIPSLDGNPNHTDILITSGFDGLRQVGDTWTYNTAGNYWTQLNTTNSQIAIRSHLGCDFHQARNMLLVFGGQNTDQFYNDLIYLNMTSLEWVEVNTTGYQPPPAAGSLNGAVANDHFYVGRYPPAISNTPNWEDMAELHIDSWEWVYYPVPTTVAFKEDEYWVSKPDASGFLLVAGQLADGASNEPTNEIWEFVPSRAQPFVELWGNVLAAEPLAGHSANLLGDVVVVFGGFQPASAAAVSDTVALNNLYFVPLRPDPTVHMQWFNLPSTGVVPSPRGYHATTLIGNQLYLFGGCSTAEGGNELGDFYTVNLGDPTDLANPSARIWVQLTNPSATTVSLPAARAGATLLHMSGLLWLVGGANTIRNGQTDVWTYDLDNEVWTHVGFDGDVTGNPNNCNFGYVQCVNDNQYIYCVGGCDTADCYNQMNVFDTVSMNWFVFLPPPGLEYQSFGHHSMVNLGDLAIVVNGGMGRDLMSTERFAMFSLSAHRSVIQQTPMADFTNGTWIREMLYINNRPPPSRDERTWVAGNTLYFQGGWGSIPFFDEAQMNTVETCLTETTYIKNTLYSTPLTPLCPVVGGSQQTNSSQCFPCDLGSFYNVATGSCSLCIPGQYQDQQGQTSCKLCSRGFFGVWYSAQSSSLCNPCPEGTYNPTPGATSCLQCNSSSFCPMSSIVPAPKSDGTNSLQNTGGVISTIQPQIAEDQSHFIATVQNLLYNTVGLILLGMFAVFCLSFAFPSTTCCWKKLNHCFAEGHWHFDPVAEGEQVIPTADNVRAVLKAQAVDVQVQARYQRLGGLLSVFAVVCSVGFSLILLVPFWQQQYEESRFMLMNALLSSDQEASIQANISLTFEFVGYSGDCVSEQLLNHASASNTNLQSPLMPANYTVAQSSGATACNSLIVVSSDFYGFPTTVACVATVVASFPTCSVTWTCVGCSMSTLVNNLAFNSEESLAYAHWIQWTFQSTTGYPDPTQVSYITGVLTPQLGMSFRGPIPSALYFSVSSSIYTFALTNYQGGGYIGEFSTSTTGTEVDSQEFELVQELQLRVQFQKTDSAIMTVKSQDSVVEDVLAALLGSVTGLLGLVSLFLFQIEKYTWRFHKNRWFRWCIDRADAAEKKVAQASSKIAPTTSQLPNPNDLIKHNLSTPPLTPNKGDLQASGWKTQSNVEGSSPNMLVSPPIVYAAWNNPLGPVSGPETHNPFSTSSLQPHAAGATGYSFGSPPVYSLSVSSPQAMPQQYNQSLPFPSSASHQSYAVPVHPSPTGQGTAPSFVAAEPVHASKPTPTLNTLLSAPPSDAAASDISIPKLQNELIEMFTPR